MYATCFLFVENYVFVFLNGDIMNLMMPRKYIYIIVAALVIAVAVFVWNWKFRVTIEAREFFGKIEKIENNVIYGKGVFVVPERPEFSSSDQIRDVKISVNSETKFVKTLVFLPSDEELKKTGGYFDGSKLPRENRDVSLEILNSELENRDITVEVKANKNIFGKSRFLAAEVRYTVQFIPEFDF